MRIQNLLVPVDFSEASEKAVVYAISLAKKLDSKIVFLHGYQIVFAAYERPSMGPTINTNMGTGLSERELSREKLMEFLDAFPQLGEIEHEDVVGLGSAVDVIRQTAENENTDLIVMGTTGADGAEGFFIGTNSEKVSRKAPCPVLVVPNNLKSNEIDINTVYLALDTNNLENTVDLKVLVALLTAFGAKLRIIHISENGETTFEKEELLTHYKGSL
ncbi:MAG: universal stress protein, partial [Pricia sp.]